MSKGKKLIPKLRFSEFLNEGGWEYLNGDKLFEPISNKNHNSDLPILAITQEQGAIPREIIDYNVSVSEKSIESYKVVEVGDFIISLRSFQGGIEYSNYLGLCSPAYIILRKKQDVLNDFYRHYFKSFPFIQDLNKNLEGIRDGKMVSYKQFSDILIPKPIKPEQQKIASFLSSLDELIAAHNDKLEALKDHKKGLMQNLFPQEGQKVPNYRFPEFEKDGEWTERKLGKVGELVGGGTPSTTNQEYWDGDIQWYTPTEVKNGTLKPSIRSITKNGLKNSSAKLLPQGTILITTRATIGDVAITNCECATNQGFQSLIVKKTEINQFWYFWILQHKHELVRRSSGSTFKEIGKNEIKVIPTLSPKKKEQQKIASCLSALDELITAQTEKIEQMQQHKKGLMQGLFPKIV